jgi:lysophospholipase L1-like esterase
MHKARLIIEFILLVLLAAFPASSPASMGKLGAMGDSLTDEYWDSGVSTYATNWTILLVKYRGIDMGPTAAQAGTNSWGSPRNAGYKYNWALSGATTASLLSSGQHTGLRSQVFSDGVSNAVLAIGPNDFDPSSLSGAYFNIYYNLWNASKIQSFVSQAVSNIETALATVRTSGVAVVLANVIDPGPTPAVTSGYGTASSRDRVSAVVQSINAGVKNLAQKYQVPLMDWYGLETAILGPNTSLHSTMKIGNVTINLRGSDSGSTPTNAFVSDGFHPNTVFQGIFANEILQAFNSGYNTGINLFSEQEILSYARISYGGSNTLQAQIGSFTNYVLLPTLPQFTGINVTGTNVALKFSTVSNQTYVIESRDQVAVGSWVAVTNNVAGNGGVVSVVTTVPPGLPQRFYRVRQLP